MTKLYNWLVCSLECLKFPLNPEHTLVAPIKPEDLGDCGSPELALCCQAAGGSRHQAWLRDSLPG